MRSSDLNHEREASGPISDEPSAGALPVGLILDGLYERFHRPEFIHPDPLEAVRAAAPADREVTALIASSLALGRVNSILDAIERVTRVLDSPREAVTQMSRRELHLMFRAFRYRFFSGSQLASFLFGVGECCRRTGSLERLFRGGLGEGDSTVHRALAHFVATLRGWAGEDTGILLSDPSKGSACKRLHLFLRWLVRRDAIDPGGWDLSPGLLLVPVDVHMLRVSRMLGFTRRKQPDLEASVEITKALAAHCPEDPVKYDFCITRLGIHPSLSYDDLIEKSSRE